MNLIATPTNLARKIVRKLRSTRQFVLAKRTIRNQITHRSLARVTELTPRKLHLGCGAIKLANYCNVDIDAGEVADIVDDITLLKKFPTNFAEQIYACHVLEHLPHDAVLPTLQKWHRVLKPGGELRVSVPDIDRIVKIYHKNWQHFQTKGHTPWIGLLYGGQSDQYDFHKTGFNFCWLSKLFEDAGFTQIKEYAHEPHFIDGAVDASLAKEPFGEFISLNIMGIKA